MNNIIKFLEPVFNATMETPTQFSPFHLGAIGITLLLCVLACIFCRKTGERANRAILLTFSIIAIILEVYKQLYFTYKLANGTYQWYVFPFQFCSMPMYIALLSAIFSKRKISTAFNTFLATFGVLAGILVMAMPGDVFLDNIMINVQTMFVHGGMIVIGVYLLASKRAGNSFKDYLKAFGLFSLCVGLALGLNIAMVEFNWIDAGQVFNMFYISPYFGCHIPVLSDIYANYSYIVFLLAYIVAFSVGALVMFLPTYIIRKIKNK